MGHQGQRIASEEFLDLVRHRLAVILEEDHQLRVSDVAARSGYAVNTIQKFRAGSAPSMRVAAVLADTIPELLAPLRCRDCGRLPGIVTPKPGRLSPSRW